MALVHHELCFGCGRANLFGLLLELEQTAPDTVVGRCFIKQDHQGADPSFAHEGVLTAALSEAMALACGAAARARTVEVRLEGQAPVGGFLELSARADAAEDDPTAPGTLRASATAMADNRLIGRATGAYRRPPGQRTG